jgi:hypothetical protein
VWWTLLVELGTLPGVQREFAKANAINDHGEIGIKRHAVFAISPFSGGSARPLAGASNNHCIAEEPLRGST